MKWLRYILLVSLLNCAGQTYKCLKDDVDCSFHLKEKTPEPTTPTTPTTTVINNTNNTTIVIENVTNITNINITINEFIYNYNFYVYINGKLITLNTDDATVTYVNGQVILTWNLEKDCDKEHEKKEHKKKPKIKKILGDDKVIHQQSDEDHE
jgi:hypothetical protein